MARRAASIGFFRVKRFKSNDLKNDKPHPTRERIEGQDRFDPHFCEKRQFHGIVRRLSVCSRAAAEGRTIDRLEVGPRRSHAGNSPAGVGKDARTIDGSQKKHGNETTAEIASNYVLVRRVGLGRFGLDRGRTVGRFELGLELEHFDRASCRSNSGRIFETVPRSGPRMGSACGDSAGSSGSRRRTGGEAGSNSRSLAGDAPGRSTRSLAFRRGTGAIARRYSRSRSAQRRG